jgi:RluA family pseudouridine synthase
MKKEITNSFEERKITSEVNTSGDGLLIDIWLSKRFTYHSRHQWQEAIKDKKILINDAHCSSSKKLKTGDKVSFIPDMKEPEVDKNYKILFEDEYLMAVNKPSFLPCHPAGPYFKNTLWYELSQQHEKVHFVNRIDRETSGLVLIAKDGKIAGKCIPSIKLKKYTVIVYGDFPDEYLAEGYLYENKDICLENPERVRKKRYFSKNQPESKSETAKTLFRKISFNGKLSTLEVNLFTGRLHQIRATLCSLGFPVVGDKIYGPDESIFLRFINDTMTEDDRNKLIIPRQALHSTQVVFTHPVSEKEIKITAHLPEMLTKLH